MLFRWGEGEVPARGEGRGEAEVEVVGEVVAGLEYRSRGE